MLYGWMQQYKLSSYSLWDMHRVAQDADTQNFFCEVLCSLRCDNLMLASLPLLTGGVKQIIVLFSMAFP